MFKKAPLRWQKFSNIYLLDDLSERSVTARTTKGLLQ